MPPVRSFPRDDATFAEAVREALARVGESPQRVEDALREQFPRARVVLQTELARDWGEERLTFYCFREGSILGAFDPSQSPRRIREREVRTAP